MPILDVEIVVDPGESLTTTLAGELADRCGAVFGSPPGGTWVKIRTILRMDYAENGGTLPESIRPIFVTILKAHIIDREQMDNEIKEITRIVAQVCGRREENVHLLYQPPGAGRVAFGGKLVE